MARKEKRNEYDPVFAPVDKYIALSSSRPTTSFYPSSASCKVGGKVVGQCLRKQYYQWKGEKVDGNVSYRTWMSGRLGSAFEEAFLEGYKGQGLLKAQQLGFRVTVMGLNISGRLDGLTKKGEVVECKSAYGKAFAYQILSKPKPEHLCQIMVYLAVLGLDTAIIPYGSRDDTAIRKGYILRKRDIEKEGILFIKIMGRWKILKRCLDTNVLPDRDFSVDDWQCSYCSYKGLCYHSQVPVIVQPNVTL